MMPAPLLKVPQSPDRVAQLRAQFLDAGEQAGAFIEWRRLTQPFGECRQFVLGVR